MSAPSALPSFFCHRVPVCPTCLPDASSAASNLPAQRPARPRVLKSEPCGLRAGTTLPSGPRALRRKDVCALRYSVPSLELLAASPAHHVAAAQPSLTLQLGGKSLSTLLCKACISIWIPWKSICCLGQEKVHLHEDCDCSLHLCCKLATEEKQAKSFVLPPHQRKGENVSVER